MFAFEKWHSAMEMRRYIMRFIHHVGGLPDLSALKFTKYNQYESLVLPMIKYLESHHVDFQFNTVVENVLVDKVGDKKVAHTLVLKQNGVKKNIELTENELVFVTNGSITESTTYGDNNTPAPVSTDLGGSWSLWKNIASQDSEFGRPEKFCDNLPEESWFVSATLTTLDDRVAPYIEKN